MRYTLVLATAVVALAQTAGAVSCHFSGAVQISTNIQTSPAECWDMSAWPEKDAKAYCAGATAKDEESVIKATQVVNCPAGSVGKCVDAPYQVPMQGMPDEYFAQMPPEMAAEIKANLAEASAATAHLKRYAGNKTTIYYYADPQKFIKLVDQQQDCKNKKGTWSR